jgi:molybdopterin/thiamine biosynthesis adenylyltransferase
MPAETAWREIDALEPSAGLAALVRPAAADPLLSLQGVPADAHARLARLDLLAVGIGGVGGPFVDYLAVLAPGTVRIVDPDLYEPENLRTQPIGPEALGRPKVEVLGRRLKARSPETRVLVAQRRFEELELADLAPCAAVALAGDNLALTVAVAQRACELGQALFHGGVHGATAVAQVRCAVAEGRARACVCCVWDAGERRALEAELRFACDGSGRSTANPSGPSGALSALGALAGSLMAFELLRWSLGLGDGQDAIVEHCALSRRTVVSPLRPSRRCPVAHAPFRRARAAQTLGELSPRQLLALAHAAPGRVARRSLEVDGWSWASRGLCECNVHPPIERFVRRAVARATAPVGRCAGCGRALRVHPFHVHERAPGASLAECAERSLAELGAGSARAALVRGPGGAAPVLVLGPEAPSR